MKLNKRISSLFIIFIIMFLSSITVLNTGGASCNIFNIVYAEDDNTTTITAKNNVSDIVNGLEIKGNSTVSQIQSNLDNTVQHGQLTTELKKLSTGIKALGFVIGAFVICVTGLKFLRTSKGDIAEFFKAKEKLKNAFIALIFFIFIPFFTAAVTQFTFPTTLNYSMNGSSLSYSANSGTGTLHSMVMGDSYLTNFVKTFPDASAIDNSKANDALSKVGDKASGGNSSNSSSGGFSSFVSGLTGLVLDAVGGILIFFVYVPLRLIDLLLGFICFAPISINADSGLYTKEIFLKLIPSISGEASSGTMTALVGSISGSLNSAIAGPLTNALKTFAAATNVIYYCIEQLCFNAIDIMCYYYAFMFLLGKTERNVMHFLKYFAEGIFGMAFAPLIVQSLLDLDMMISTDIISLVKKTVPGYSFLSILPDIKSSSGTLLIVFSIMLAVCVLLLCKTFFIRKIEITICYMFSPIVFLFHMGAFKGRDPVQAWFKRLVSSVFITTIYVPFFVIAQLLILVAQSVSNDLISTLLLYVFIIALLLGMNKAAKEVPAILGLHSESFKSAGDAVGKFSSINGIKDAFGDAKDMLKSPVSAARDISKFPTAWAQGAGKIGLGTAKTVAEAANIATLGKAGKMGISAKGVDNTVKNLDNKHKQFKEFLKNKDDLSEDRKQEFFKDFFSAEPKNEKDIEAKQGLIDGREKAYKENENIENELSDLNNIEKTEEDIVNKDLETKNTAIDNKLSDLTGENAENEKMNIQDFLRKNTDSYEQIKAKDESDRTNEEAALMTEYDDKEKRLNEELSKIENEEQMQSFINKNKTKYDQIMASNIASRKPEDIAFIGAYESRNEKLHKIDSLRRQKEKNRKDAQDSIKRLRNANKKQKTKLMDKHNTNRAKIEFANKTIDAINAANMSTEGGRINDTVSKAKVKVTQAYVNANMSKTAEGIANIKNGDIGKGVGKIIKGQTGLNGSDKDKKYTKVKVETPKGSVPIVTESNRYQSKNSPIKVETPKVQSKNSPKVNNTKVISTPGSIIKNKYLTNKTWYNNMDPGVFKAGVYTLDATANVTKKGVEVVSKVGQKGKNLLNYFDTHKK